MRKWAGREDEKRPYVFSPHDGGEGKRAFVGNGRRSHEHFGGDGARGGDVEEPLCSGQGLVHLKLWVWLVIQQHIRSFTTDFVQPNLQHRQGVSE